MPSPRSRTTHGHRLVGEAGELQSEVVLIGPEPGHCETCCSSPPSTFDATVDHGLVVCVPPGSRAVFAVRSKSGCGKRATVAGREDQFGSSGAQTIIDGHAVVTSRVRCRWASSTYWGTAPTPASDDIGLDGSIEAGDLERRSPPSVASMAGRGPTPQSSSTPCFGVAFHDARRPTRRARPGRADAWRISEHRHPGIRADRAAAATSESDETGADHRRPIARTPRPSLQGAVASSRVRSVKREIAIRSMGSSARDARRSRGPAGHRGPSRLVGQRDRRGGSRSIASTAVRRAIRSMPSSSTRSGPRHERGLVGRARRR